MPFMDYVNRDVLASVNNQVLSSFDWDFDITFPTTYAPYYPPKDIIKQRLKKITGVKFTKQHQAKDVMLRGNKLLFPGWVDNSGGQITLNFIDYADLSMTAWINDWTKKCNDWKTHQSFPKSAVYVDFTFYQLDTFRNPVFRWEFKTGIITSNSTEEPGQDTKEILNDNISMTLDFEYCELIPLTART